jgi:hypothetical protein
MKKNLIVYFLTFIIFFNINVCSVLLFGSLFYVRGEKAYPRNSETLTNIDIQRAFGPSGELNGRNVTVLSLSNCFKLTEIFTLPNSLKVLNIKNCINLKKLPNNLPSSLQVLIISNCPNIFLLCDLPLSLSTLYLENCECIRLQSLVLLTSLTELYIIGCRKIVKIPELPPGLQVLFIKNCENLKTLSIVLPSSLVELCVNRCEKIVSLPQLPSVLNYLSLEGCSSLSLLPTLPLSLISLNIDCCNRLRVLPVLPSSLISLSLSGCTGLDANDLYGLVNLSLLESLDISYTNIRRLPDIRNFCTNLSSLDATDAPLVEEIDIQCVIGNLSLVRQLLDAIAAKGRFYPV